MFYIDPVQVMAWPLYVAQLQPNVLVKRRCNFYDVEFRKGMCWEGVVPIGECVGRV